MLFGFFMNRRLPFSVRAGRVQNHKVIAILDLADGVGLGQGTNEMFRELVLVPFALIVGRKTGGAIFSANTSSRSCNGGVGRRANTSSGVGKAASVSSTSLTPLCSTSATGDSASRIPSSRISGNWAS